LITGPSVASVTNASATLSATINEAGTGYYLVQLATAATPSYTTVWSSPTGSFAMSANSAATATLSLPSAATNYNVYFVARDTAGNWGQMQFVAFTSAATTGTTGATTGTATTGGSPP
jgi:hypothetical protein